MGRIDRLRRNDPESLHYCDLETGNAARVSGTFENFCYDPVFSRSGQHVFLGVPFENAVVGFDVDELALEQVRTAKGRAISAMPLHDLGSLPPAL